MSNLKNKRVITAALCGSWATKDMNPAVPYTPEEIARDAYECWKAGAAIVHIHVRNADGSPSTKFELYKETIERIRAFPDCDVCLNITSSGSVDFGDEERIYPLQQLLPELASYDAGTLNWQNRTVFMNPPAFLEKLGYALQESNIKPEIEIFDAGMIYNTLYYLKKGGRITPAAAAIGTMLRLKPVLTIQGEKLDAFAKARTTSQGKTMMINAIKKDINERFGGMTEDKHIWLQIAYTHDRAAAEQFRTEVEAEFPGYDIHIDPLSLSVACHIGPGALALACCKKITV